MAQRPLGVPALNCARTDDHPAHKWTGKPLPARTPTFWCDPADLLADRRLSERARLDGYTVEIGASDAGRQIWQAVHPAERLTAGMCRELFGPDVTARDVALITAHNQDVADGPHWRVRVWAGPDADTGTPPAAVVYAEEVQGGGATVVSLTAADRLMLLNALGAYTLKWQGASRREDLYHRLSNAEAPTEVRTEWAVRYRWLPEWGGHQETRVLTNERSAGICFYDVRKSKRQGDPVKLSRQVHVYPDGSTWTGPWMPVDG